MKTLLIGICCFTTLFAAAQENPYDGSQPTLVNRMTDGKVDIKHVDVNFQVFTSGNANFIENELENMDFKLNRVKLEIKGDVNDWFSYHYRQSFNKYADPYSLDNLSSSVELAYVNLRVSPTFVITTGKHAAALGGYEYYVNPIKVREFSEFNNQLSCYQAGIMGTWTITPYQELCFQVMNNRSGSIEETFVGGLPEGVEAAKVPFFYSVNWNSLYFDKVLQLRYALSMADQAKGCRSFYATCGNIIEKGPVITYLDLMYTRQELDQHGIISHLVETERGACNTEYFSAIADFDYRFHDHWNAYVKGTYEIGRVYKANGAYDKGMYRRSWNAQACVEYFPMKNSELLIFLLYSYRGVKLEQNALRLGAAEPNQSRISLGFVYSIPVF